MHDMYLSCFSAHFVLRLHTVELLKIGAIATDGSAKASATLKFIDYNVAMTFILIIIIIIIIITLADQLLV